MSNRDSGIVEELDLENKALKASLKSMIFGYVELSDALEADKTDPGYSSRVRIEGALYRLAKTAQQSTSQSLADIKADAINELIKEKAYSAPVDGIATSIINADDAIQHADKLRGVK